jgi:hypothetical protein
MRGAPKSVGSVSLRYALRSGAVEERAIDLGVVATPQVGLARGAMLVDEVTAFKKATALHHEQNDQEGAWRLVHELSGRWAGTADPELARELELIASLESTLALLSGHRGEGPVGTLGRSGLSGLPATVRGR